MTNLADDDLTQAVLASFDGARGERFKTVAQSLVRHLHAFITEVELSEDEWRQGIDFLTRVGHITDERRQEFILLSDVLGASMLVIGINHRAPGSATESTVFGPFFVEGSPAFENGDDLAAGAPGEPCLIEGRALSTDGTPLSGARIEVWQADEDGLYDVQRSELTQPQGRGHLHATEDGRFWFWTVKPQPYPIPDDGPVGELLAAGGRSPMRPAHVHFMITAPGHRPVVTHLFVDGERQLDSDAVFGVKASLITAFERHDPGRAPDGRELATPYWTAGYDFVLAPSG
jgi:hydroxyquinol 1,2-dioxygenase